MAHCGGLVHLGGHQLALPPLNTDLVRNPVTPVAQPAPLSRRFAAFCFDFAVVAGYLAVLLGIGMGLAHGGAAGLRPLTPGMTDLVAFLLTVLPVALYFALQEGSPSQATWGKRRAGIRVASAAGGPLGYRGALVRSLVKFAPWQLAHTSLVHVPGWPAAPGSPSALVMTGFVVAQGLVVLYVALMAFTPTRRAPYDWIAGSIVIAESEARHQLGAGGRGA